MSKNIENNITKERGENNKKEGINIILNKKYTLTSDARCYTLNQNSINKKTNQEYLKPVGYYGTIEGAFQGLYSREIRIRKANTIEELLHNVKELKSEIHNIMERIEKLLM